MIHTHGHVDVFDVHGKKLSMEGLQINQCL